MFDDDFDDAPLDEGDDFGWWHLPPLIIRGTVIPIRFHYCDRHDKVTLNRVVTVSELLGSSLDRPTHLTGHDKKRGEARTFLICSLIEPRTAQGDLIGEAASWLMAEANRQWLIARDGPEPSWNRHLSAPVMIRRSKQGDMVYPHHRTEDWWSTPPPTPGP